MTLSLTSAGADRSHIERRNAILAKYPQVRELFGTDILTFKITVALFLLQLAIAGFLGWLGLAYWPLTVFLAFCVGAFANHANFVIIHDFDPQLRLQEQSAEQAQRAARRSLERLPDGHGLSLLPHQAPLASLRL